MPRPTTNITGRLCKAAILWARLVSKHISADIAGHECKIQGESH